MSVEDHIVVIKLLNGLDIIATIVDETEDTVEVENPFKIAFSQTEGGAVMTPYNLFSDDHNFRFKNESIITISNASKTVCEYYLDLASEFTKYIEDKQTVEEYAKLLDEIGIPKADDDTFQDDYTNRILLEGNDTKH